ncbi:MAG: ester cyclase [Actinobacteria bacterium]|nr:ester cyclase [Actinomycetota bacterium]
MSEPEPIGTATTASPAARSHSRASDLVRAFYEPFRTGDTSIYRDILAADWADLPLAPGQEQGPAGIGAQVGLFRQAFPDYDVTHEDLIVGDDRVAVRNTVTGTHQGAFMGYAATGRRIAIRTMDLHRIRDDRIAITWHLEDFAGLIAQLSGPDEAAGQPGPWT